jgi:hypothetical protein
MFSPYFCRLFQMISSYNPGLPGKMPCFFTASLYIGERLLKEMGRHYAGESKKRELPRLCGWRCGLWTEGNCVLFAGANLSGEKRSYI